MPEDGSAYTPEQAIEKVLSAGSPDEALKLLSDFGYELAPSTAAPLDEAPLDEAPPEEAPLDEAPLDEAPLDESEEGPMDIKSMRKRAIDKAMPDF